MSDVNTLFEYAQELLSNVEAALSYTVGGVPSPSFVSPGLPSFDCPEQLTVHVQTIGMENTNPLSPSPETGHRVPRGPFMNLATLVAIVIRCQPQMEGITDLPSASSIEAAAQKVNQDVWAIWNYLKSRDRDGSLFEGRCVPFYMDPPAIVSPQGGSAGWAFQVRVQIGGFDMAVSSP